MDKKIALFAYNFPHKKTQDFIFQLLANGYRIDVIYAADAVKLNIPSSVIRAKISHLGLIHPQKIAQNLGIEYLVLQHSGEDICNDLEKRKIDIGIIAGARILKKDVISKFTYGIINFHPGIIPSARGLDALTWSIYNKHPLGVTAHLIDYRIDAGSIIDIQKIKIKNDDTLLDLSERLYDVQLDMLPQAIEKVIKNETFLIDDYGNYNKKMPKDIELTIDEQLPAYIELYVNE